METIACNLCSSTRLSKSLRGPDVRYRTPGTFTVVRCDECGLCFVSPRPTIDEIGAHYPPTYSEHNSVPGANPFARAQVEIVESRFPSAGSVLDVGCASGVFLGAMQQQGWRVAGTDTNAQAHKIASAVPGADVRLGTLHRGDFASGSFDAVTMWSVLEHLHDPLDTLRIARDLLKPTGRLFLVVPNYGALERRLFRTRWFALELPRHLYHFAPASLRKMLSAGGFEVEQLQHASGHDCFRWSLRLLVGLPVDDDLNNDGSEEATGGSAHGSGQRERAAQALRKAKGLAVNAFTTTADRVGAGAQLVVVARPRTEGHAG